MVGPNQPQRGSWVTRCNPPSRSMRPCRPPLSVDQALVVCNVAGLYSLIVALCRPNLWPPALCLPSLFERRANRSKHIIMVQEGEANHSFLVALVAPRVGRACREEVLTRPARLGGAVTTSFLSERTNDAIDVVRKTCHASPPDSRGLRRPGACAFGNEQHGLGSWPAAASAGGTGDGSRFDGQCPGAPDGQHVRSDGPAAPQIGAVSCSGRARSPKGFLSGRVRLPFFAFGQKCTNPAAHQPDAQARRVLVCASGQCRNRGR
jgi:hypothetical protein